MFKHGKKILLGAGVLAAISFGGTALSAAGAAPATPVVQHSAGAAQVKHGTTGSTVKSGARTGAQRGEADEETNDGVNDGETQDGAQGGNDSETQDGPQAGQDSETSDGSAESGSEVAGNDGPSGHADEPGQPNAQNQE